MNKEGLIALAITGILSSTVCIADSSSDYVLTDSETEYQAKRIHKGIDPDAQANPTSNSHQKTTTPKKGDAPLGNRNMRNDKLESAANKAKSRQIKQTQTEIKPSAGNKYPGVGW